ncbi:hypothetical protein F5144DRAFT_207411 [Chaetomium tenue]|uniref:Uncharacterized protein n=1 Tax=Chaetomium tenue TaxID=1854479 RepID=A0ACB7PED2_9PEZI|nr:hypothetical protein F5144DRAFT_207411 [Chaetomium globosum]
MSSAAGKKKAAAPPAPVYVPAGNGYYRLQGGDADQLYFLGSDNQYHPVLRVRVAAGAVMPQADRDALVQYLMAHNNVIANSANQGVRITSVIVTESLHKSKSTDSKLTDHYSVQLSNSTLQANDGSSHLLHFRPGDGNDQFYYRDAMTRTQITNLQAKRNANRHRKKGGGAGGNNNNKKPPPSGGGSKKKVVVQK